MVTKCRPTSQDAARRLLVLKYVVAYAIMAPPRAVLAGARSKSTPEEQLAFDHHCERTRDTLCQSLRARGLWEFLSPRELEIVKNSFVTLTHPQHVDATWRMEAAQVLMWALGAIDHLPPYDELANRELLKNIPANIPEYIRSAQLRSDAEIDRARQIAEFWHWRSRTRQLVERSEPFPAEEKLQAAGIRSFGDVVRVSAARAYENGTLALPIDGDFPVKEKAYRDLTPAEYSVIKSITVERHVALNWLCGYAPDNRWDETPTPT